MSDILTTINAYKKLEIAERKKRVPISILEKSTFFGMNCYSLRDALLRDSASGIIAEFKRKSPSKGMINDSADVIEVTKGYLEAGASALSVLTDLKFFGGLFQYFSEARAANSCPILQKDFIVDEYQVIEAKALGSDVILLIAAGLTPAEVRKFAILAHSLQMEVLLEVHNEKEIGHYCPEVGLIGVNNRNLNTFEVNIDTAITLFPLLPSEIVSIAESGLSRPETVNDLRKYGYKGFLIGEFFMKSDNPAKACRKFIEKLNSSVNSSPVQ
jgi:indole-3-glycerol phosphate synthase